MTIYKYKGQQISHTAFLSLLHRNGITSGYRISHREHLQNLADKGHAKAIELLADLEIITADGRGGARPGAGRPVTNGRHKLISVRISQEAFDIYNAQKNKAEFIDALIKGGK